MLNERATSGGAFAAFWVQSLLCLCIGPDHTHTSFVFDITCGELQTACAAGSGRTMQGTLTQHSIECMMLLLQSWASTLFSLWSSF